MKDLMSVHKKVHIQVDGSCKKNPGISGAGVAFFGIPKDDADLEAESFGVEDESKSMLMNRKIVNSNRVSKAQKP